MTGNSSKLNGFGVYKEYLALKLHFTKDGYEYHGPDSRVSHSSFVNRRDRYHFEKLAGKKDPKGILIASLLADGGSWIGDIAGEPGAEAYLAFQQRRQSLSYRFARDLELLEPDFDNNIRVSEGKHPTLIRLYLSNEIMLETVCILADLTKCVDYWERNLGDDPIWQSIRLPIVKYLPFLSYDKKKLKQLVVDKFKRPVV